MIDASKVDYSWKNALNIQENQNELEPRNNEKVLSISKIISELLINICEERKINLDSKSELIKQFIAKKKPKISINDYIDRLIRYSKTNSEIIIIILIYLDRICTKHNINLNYYNIHKLILAAFIVAIKNYEDNHYSIDYYAKLGGISKKEAIKLEYEFMILIDFNLFIEQRLYNNYYNNLLNMEENDEDIFDENDVYLN